MAVIIAVLVLAGAAWFVAAWGIMLTGGIIHAHVLEAVNPFGFGVALSLSAVPIVVALLGHLINAILEEIK